MNKSTFIIAVCFAVIWFALLGYRDLIEPDEGRYAEIPREMYASGDWLTPRLNGFKYFEKPAFQYWATAVSYHMLGVNNTAARLWPAVTGFLCALFIWFLGSQLYGQRAGFYAFVITLSSFLYIALGHILTLDMAVAVFLVIGIGSLTLAQSQRQDAAFVRKWMLIGWASLAIATLTKGLIGIVLPAGAVVIYSLWQRDWALWKNLHIGKGLAIFLAITAPWFIKVSITNPEFAEFFFIHEHLARYTSAVHEREEPIWYFAALLAIGVLPWFYPMLKAVVITPFKWRVTDQHQFNAERFLWTFALFVLAFFSLSHSKLPPYILPMFPVLSLFAGMHLAKNEQDRSVAWFMLLMAIGLLAVAWQLEQFGTARNPAEMLIQCRPWAIAAAFSYFIGAILALNAKKNPLVLLGATGLCALLAAQLLSWGFQPLSSFRSSKELADAIQAAVPRGTEVFSVKTYYPQSLPFYLDSTITLVDYKGEMDMGVDLELDKWIGSDEVFIQRWQAANQAVAIMDRDVYPSFLERGLPMKIIYENPRRMAVVKP